MNFFSRIALLLPVFWIVLAIALPSQAEDTSKYGQWQVSDEKLDKMIIELDQIIDEGIKSRAAHPGFLQDLQRIIDQYRIPKKLVYFADDFADNNFTENPTWSVKKGIFSIDTFGSLYSSIAVRRPVVKKEPESKPEGDKSLRILLGVLNELAKEETQEEQTQVADNQGMITSNAEIPNSFNLEFSFRSNANWGSTSIGVIQGDDPMSGYHLVYQASPAENRPMQLMKYRYGKPYIIEEAHENSPNLDDGTDHIVQLIRSPNGDMVVTVDGNEVMRTADLSYKETFTGILISNNGGTYSYDNIEFFIEQ